METVPNVNTRNTCPLAFEFPPDFRVPAAFTWVLVFMMSSPHWTVARRVPKLELGWVRGRGFATTVESNADMFALAAGGGLGTMKAGVRTAIRSDSRTIRLDKTKGTPKVSRWIWRTWLVAGLLAAHRA